MGKYEKLEPVGQCPVCTINVYDIGGKIQPQVMPCGIGGEYRQSGGLTDGVKREVAEPCPHETEAERLAIQYSYDRMIVDLHRKPG